MQRSLKTFIRCLSTLHPHQGPPVRVAFTSNAGRGVYATRKIDEGGLIHTAEPLISHPSLQNISKVCYFCLARLGNSRTARDTIGSLDDISENVYAGMQPRFCSQKCSASAEAFYTIEKKVRWESFYEFCRYECLRFPLLARRLVCMVLAGEESRDALEVLSWVNPSGNIISRWMHTREILINALEGSGIAEEELSFVSGEWYCGVLARLSLNSFRIEHLAEDTTNLLLSAVASVSGDAISGSAVYILPSMYNHDCDPNVDISWPKNSTAHLRARRDIEEGEELRITYIDASMPLQSRQQLLKQAYHFVCGCSRCKDDD